MNFEVYGGFESMRKKNRHGVFDKSLWQDFGDVQNGCGRKLAGSKEHGRSYITSAQLHPELSYSRAVFF